MCLKPSKYGAFNVITIKEAIAQEQKIASQIEASLEAQRDDTRLSDQCDRITLADGCIESDVDRQA